jgi:hypothetical protein
MGNSAMSIAIMVVGGGNGSIQAAQGQRRLISMQGCRAERAGLIKWQQRAPPDGRGDNSDSIMIAENNTHWTQWNREDN